MILMILLMIQSGTEVWEFTEHHEDMLFDCTATIDYGILAADGTGLYENWIFLENLFYYY